MGGSSKKGSDDNDIPQINPQQLIDQAIAANRVNVSTPFGSQTYNGNTLTTQLSPEMQALLGQQMARAGGSASQYVLPGANADILNGLNTRLDQRYGIPAAPTGGSGNAPGSGGGGAPGPVIPPTTPPAAPPAQPPVIRPPTSGPGTTPGGGGLGEGAFGPGSYASPSGGNNGQCVVADSFLPGGARAAEAIMGHAYPVHLPESGFHSWPLEYRADLVKVPCVRLTVAGGASIRCSRTTPFTSPSATRDLQDGHWAYAPDMLGQSVFVLTPTGHDARVVEAIDDIGEQWVVPLSFGGRSFAAGDNPDALIYSHNVYKMFDGSSQIDAAQQAIDGWSNSPNSTYLGGSMDQSHAAAANFGFGPTAAPSYTPMGGYLGSGSYEGMGQGLAAAQGGAQPAQSPTASSPPPSGFGGGSASSGGAFGLPYGPDPISPMPALSKPIPHKSWLDSRYTKLAAALLGGPAGAFVLGGVNKFRHRNDD